MDQPELSWSDGATPLLTDPQAASFGVRVAFTSRVGGFSKAPYDSLNLSPFIGDEPDAVGRNHSAVLTGGGFPAGSLSLVKQVHGADVLVAEEPRGVVGEADGLFVGPDGGTTLGVLTADCVPVLIKGSLGIAAAHAGWRGVVGGVIEAAVERTGTVEAAWVGPSIQACCYEVGNEVIAAFDAKELPIAERRADGGRVAPGVGAATILRRLGAPYVAQTPLCTSCDERFFSYRRDGVTGRQAGLIAWE